MHTHGIPGAKIRDVVAQLRGLDVIERIHGILQEGEASGNGSGREE